MPDDAVDIELQPGEFSLHHVRLVHGSDPNPSGRPAHRLCDPLHSDLRAADRRAARLRDPGARRGYLSPLRSGAVPKADLDPEAVALHKRVTEESEQILYRGTDKRNPK